MHLIRKWASWRASAWVLICNTVWHKSLVNPATGRQQSNHRLYSYRMKKQGRIWSEAGAEAIAQIITGQRNGDLARAMSQHKEGYARKPSREYKDAVRNALKKLKAIPHIGAQMGRMAMNCPSSSAIGRLSQSISFCGINIWRNWICLRCLYFKDSWIWPRMAWHILPLLLIWQSVRSGI